MILVMTGTEVHPFDRLVRAADELQRTGALGEDFFIQLGSSRYEPRHARFERFLPFGEICERIQVASAVVTHAGAGSTLVCIQHGKHPVIVPRRAAMAEHVDEHQLRFAERFGDGRLATAVYEMGELPAAIRTARARSGHRGAALGRAVALTGWLEGYWREIARRAADRPGGASRRG